MNQLYQQVTLVSSLNSKEMKDKNKIRMLQEKDNFKCVITLPCRVICQSSFLVSTNNS
jgi:hypothetical protein